MTPLLESALRAEAGALVAAAVVWVVAHLVGGRLPARWRYNLWLLVLLRLCLPVLPMIPVHVWTRSSPPAPVVEVAPPIAPIVGERASKIATVDRPVPPPEVVARPVERSEPPINPVRWLIAAWAIVAAALLARLLIQTVRTGRLIRGYPPVTDATHLAQLAAAASEIGVRPPPAVVAPVGTGPAVAGLLRPRLLLPADLADRLPADGFRLVLLHELAHVRRWDVPIGWLASAVAALHWFNPAAWLALWQLRAERELAADAAVLDVTVDVRAAYGDALVRLIGAHSTPSPAVGSAMAEPVQSLHRRITMIALHKPRSGRPSGIVAIVLPAVAAAALLWGEPARPTLAAEPAQAAQTTRPLAVAGQDALDRPVAVPALEGRRLDEVVADLRSSSGIDVRLSDLVIRRGDVPKVRLPWAAPAGWTRPELSEVLRYVLDDVEAGRGPRTAGDAASPWERLTIAVVKGTVTIGYVRELAMAALETRTYDVGSIVGAGPERPRRTVALQQYLIEQASPSEWSEYGGVGHVTSGNIGGSIAFDGTLVVRQSAAGQRRVAAELDRLRAGDPTATRAFDMVLGSDAAAYHLLDKHIPVRFSANHLSDVIDFFRDVTEATIIVDWPALQRAGVTPATPVTIHLWDVPFSTALRSILGGITIKDDYDHRLAYAAGDGVITITTQRELDKGTVTCRYDLRQLLAGSADPAARTREIVEYLTDNAEPASWQARGGAGTITVDPAGQALLVTQASGKQRQVAMLLFGLQPGQSLAPAPRP